MKADMRKIESAINTALRAMPAERRPETPWRSKIQSVAYAARGAMEATDREGRTYLVPVSEAAKWANL